MMFSYQILLLFCFTLVILADESTEKSPTEDEKTEKPTEPEDDVDVSVQPIEKKNKKKNNQKDKEAVTPKKPQLEFPNFSPFQLYPEFYNPSLKPDFIPPGSLYYPYSGYPSFSPRFGGQFPGIPVLFPEIPSKKDKPSSKDKDGKSKGDSSEKDESEEIEGSGKEEEEPDKEEDNDKENGKPNNGKPRISIIRVLQLPVFPVLRGPASWAPPRIDTIPLDPIPNTISFDAFGTRIGNPWYSGPFLGRSFAPQYILRK